MPPTIPQMSAMMVSPGSASSSASTFGRIRKRPVSKPSVTMASISSVVFMVPSSAANAEPERPASTTAVTSGASSFTITVPTRLTT